MKLFEHQLKALQIADEAERFGFYWDTGTGKTHAAIAIMERHNKRKWLVTCPSSVITSWRSALESWPTIKSGIISGKLGADYYHNIPWIQKQKMTEVKSIIMKSADVVVINHEILHKYYKLFMGYNLIVDEAHKINGHKTKIAKAVYSLSNKAQRLYSLTATPAPNNILDFWPQAEILNKGMFGPRGAFLAKFGVPIQIQSNAAYKITIGWRAHQWAKEMISEAMKPYCWILPKRDCVDLPPLTTLERMCYLSAPEMAIYNNYKELYGGFNQSNIFKLLQISSGTVYSETGVERIHERKIPELIDAVSQCNGKVIIWVAFNHERDLIHKSLEKIGLRGYNQGDVEKFISDPLCKYIVAHPASLGTGYDGLQKVCDTMIWYSPTYSYQQYYQAVGRLERVGQQNNITVIQLRVDTPADRAAWSAIEAKEDLMDYLARRLK